MVLKVVSTGAGGGGSGTVTSISGTAGEINASPSPITSTGALSLANITVTGTYGNATTVPVVTIDAKGRVTNVANVTIAGTQTAAVGYWGSFWDTTNQTAANVTTAFAISLNNSDANNNGVSIVSGDRITFFADGVYNLQYSIQFKNTDTSSSANNTVNVWLRKNDSGTAGDIADSNSIYTVPLSHGGVDGTLIAAVNYVTKVAAGDFFQLMWQPESTAITISTLPAGTTPTTPEAPGVIFTATQVANAIPGAPTGNAGGQLSGTYPNPNINSSVVIANLRLSNLNVANVSTTFPNSFLANSSTTLGNTALTLGSTTSSVGNLTLANVTILSGTVPNTAVTNGNITLGNTTVGLGNTATSIGNVTLANVTIISGTSNLTTFQSTSNTAANATFSSATMMLIPAGYIIANVNSVNVKIPYYSV